MLQALDRMNSAHSYLPYLPTSCKSLAQYTSPIPAPQLLYPLLCNRDSLHLIKLACGVLSPHTHITLSFVPIICPRSLFFNSIIPLLESYAYGTVQETFPAYLRPSCASLNPISSRWGVNHQGTSRSGEVARLRRNLRHETQLFLVNTLGLSS